MWNLNLVGHLPAECANPRCYLTDGQQCKDCEATDVLVVLTLDSPAETITQADFIEGKWFSLSGHEIQGVTHWMRIKLP